MILAIITYIGGDIPDNQVSMQHTVMAAALLKLSSLSPPLSLSLNHHTGRDIPDIQVSMHTVMAAAACLS